jgi:hypothetical protein
MEKAIASSISKQQIIGSENPCTMTNFVPGQFLGYFFKKTRVLTA